MSTSHLMVARKDLVSLHSRLLKMPVTPSLNSMAMTGKVARSKSVKIGLLDHRRLEEAVADLVEALEAVEGSAAVVDLVVVVAVLAVASAVAAEVLVVVMAVLLLLLEATTPLLLLQLRQTHLPTSLHLAANVAPSSTSAT